MAFFKLELKTLRLCFKVGYALLVAGLYVSLIKVHFIPCFNIIYNTVRNPLISFMSMLIIFEKRDGKCFALTFCIMLDLIS